MSSIHGINQRYLYLQIIGVMLFVAGFSIGYADGTPIKNPQQKFYIDIGKKAETKLLRKVRSLKLGTSVDEAKAVVGEPTDDQMLIGKKGEFHARELSYYIRKLDTGVNELHDEYVVLFFDETNKLTKVIYKPKYLESKIDNKIK